MFVDRYESHGKLKYPVTEDGYYLDPATVRRNTALLLTSPWGAMNFVVGDGVNNIYLEYARLADGNYVLQAIPNVPYVGVPVRVVSDAEAPGAARLLVQEALDSLAAAGVAHDEELLEMDADHFFRAVSRDCGVRGYASMTPEELRRGVRGNLRLVGIQ